LVTPFEGLTDANPTTLKPGDTAVLTAAFDAALRKLALVDRHDPAAIAIGKLIVITAKKGERDPPLLCNHVVSLWRNRWPPQSVH
jgi:hypothetical protein